MIPCGCEPILLPDGIGHAPDCTRGYDGLHTAEDIAGMREILMQCTAAHEADNPEDIHAIRDRMAAGITARAVQLGLEKP